MLVPVSWLREIVALPDSVTSREIAERLVRAGLEVETVDEVGADVSGPLVVGRVLSYETETHSNGKTIRWLWWRFRGRCFPVGSRSQLGGRTGTSPTA